MNIVSRLVFIVYAAVFFSSNVFALNSSFIIVNSSHWTIDIKDTNNNYCVYWTSPYEMRVVPHSHFTWTVAYKTTWFTKCSVYHSSQEFNITFTLGNENYATTFQWYKPVGKDAQIRLPKFPDYLKIKVTNEDGSYRDFNGRIVTFTSLK